MLDDLTALIITFNEEANIARTLDRLTWMRRIVVIDSGSTDGTLDILARYPQVQVVERAFDDFASQCNFGLQRIETPWVLSLDADYELSAPLVDELKRLTPHAAIAGYRAAFIYRMYGRPLRGTLYPPRTVLYRRDKALYRKEAHGHRVTIDGEVGRLSGPVYHDDRKPLARWFESQIRYARAEAEHLLTADPRALSRVDRLRRAAWPAPFAVLGYTLFVKGCVLDGWPGWAYALQRLLAETMIALQVIDRRYGQGRGRAS